MKFNFLSITAIAFSVLFMACSDKDDVTSEYGRLNVQLTDAPFPHDLVAEANVTIFKVDARNKGGVDVDDSQDTENNEANTEAENGSPFVVLMENEVQVNLLDLTNGVTKSLVDIDVPVGTYDLVRVYVKGVNVVLTDGTTYDLKVPSGSQTGIKIFIKPGLTVNGGLSSDLLLDFDVSKSFVAKGSNPITGFNFKPVIKASNLSTAGTLAGMVTEIIEETSVAVEGAQVAVFVADTLNTTTFSDVDGGYMIMGLNAGMYTVKVEKEGYSMLNVEGVQIDAANKTVQNFEMELDQ